MALKTKANSLRSDPTCFLWGMRAAGCICTSSKATRSHPSGENTRALYSFSVGMFLQWLWHPTPPVAAAGGRAAAHTGTCAAGPGAPRLSPNHWQPPASSTGCAASSKCHLACYDFVLRYQFFFFFPVEGCVCKCDARFLGCRQPVGNFAPVKTN